MKITEDLEPAVRLLEARHPDLDLRASIQHLHENDFAALVLHALNDQIPPPAELPHGR